MRSKIKLLTIASYINNRQDKNTERQIITIIKKTATTSVAVLGGFAVNRPRKEGFGKLTNRQQLFHTI